MITKIRYTTRHLHALFFGFLLLFGGLRHDCSVVASIHRSSIECDLYLAESTILNAGLGLFVGSEKNVGDTVGAGDVCLPLFDLEAHNGYFDLGNDEYVGEEFHDTFADYVWDGVGMGMGMEVEDHKVTALWPGLDCAINCNLPLINVKKAHPDTDYLGLHRSKDPMAGAMTPYRGGTTKVIQSIPAGGELFKDYGDDWFKTRPIFPPGLPLSTDFPRAIELLKSFFDSDFVSKLSNSIHQNLFQFLREDINYVWDGRTLNALPTDYKTAQLAHEKEDLRFLHQPNCTRSIAWLQEHGTCVDHIVHAPSTLVGAGEGAFAKRDLPKGTIVAGSPLQHIPDGNYLSMYEFVQPNPEEYPQWFDRIGEPIGYQIALNYCIGHPDSSILLFPYSPGVNYINHNQTMANIEIRWAPNGKLGHDESWLEIPPESMEFEFGTRLGIEYIARNDIKAGDELFLDYGDVWESAWLEYVKDWQATSESYMPAAEWNELMKPIRTKEKQKYVPYPENVEIRCHVNLIAKDWKKNEGEYGWSRHGDEHWDDYHFVYGLPCEILDRDDRSDTYTVDISVDALTFVEIPDDIEKKSKRRGVPREAIFFVDTAGSTDMHLPNAFRQEIQLPERMMPNAWRNRKYRPPNSSEGEL